MCLGCIAGSGNSGNYEEAINELYQDKNYATKSYETK